VQQYTGLELRADMEIEDNDLSIAIALQSSFLDKQLDNLNKNSKTVSLPHGNGTLLPFGPRISHWHFESLDGLSGNTKMRHYPKGKSTTNVTQEWQKGAQISSSMIKHSYKAPPSHSLYRHHKTTN
jgi:hypothetical protein